MNGAVPTVSTRQLRTLAIFVAGVLALLGMVSVTAPAAPKKPVPNPRGAVKPTVTKKFMPSQFILSPGPAQLKFRIENPAGNPALNGLGFSDGLPAGLIYGAKTKTCTGSAIGALVVSGVSVPAGPSSCEITINFVAKECGIYSNTAANAKSKTLNVANLAADLSVVGSPPCPQFKMPDAPGPSGSTTSSPSTSLPSLPPAPTSTAPSSPQGLPNPKGTPISVAAR